MGWAESLFNQKYEQIRLSRPGHFGGQSGRGRYCRIHRQDILTGQTTTNKKQMSKHTLIVVGLLGGIAVGYLMVGTVATYPIYSSVYNFGLQHSTNLPGQS
jgi:hypothetical protein